MNYLTLPGQFLAELERHDDAANHYLKAAQLAPSEYEIIFNAANTLRQAGRNHEAEHYYRLAVQLRPQVYLIVSLKCFNSTRFI